jgi:hypothetical protein
MKRKEKVGTSRIISRVLSPAVQLWLRSQVEHVEDLHFTIEGSDGQILHGIIPQVAIAARKAVYQGLHLSQVSLTGTGIKVNLGQILKGKPLRLLEPIPVEGELRLGETDLNASLEAPLLAIALQDFLVPLLPLDHKSEESKLQKLLHPQIHIEEGRLTLRADLLFNNGKKIPFVLRTGLGLASKSELLFVEPEIEGWEGNPLDNFQINLGSEVEIKELSLTAGELFCQGNLRVLP